MDIMNTTRVNTKSPAPVIGIEAKRQPDKATCIAVAAYFKAEARGYELGHEIQDWLEAEAKLVKDK